MTLDILDQNEGPKVSFVRQVFSKTSVLPTVADLKVARFSIVDDALGSRSITLSGQDAKLFKVTGDGLYLVSGFDSDLEFDRGYRVNISVNDAGLTPSPNDSAVFVVKTHDLLRGFTGTDKKNKLTGTAGDDDMYGFGRSDRMFGKGGQDDMSGGAGNDKIRGNGGADTIDGDRGNDKIWGGHGNDNLNGSSGNDVLNGQAGRDRLSGGRGEDILAGEAGKDVLIGGRDADTFIYAKKDGKDVVVDFEDGTDTLQFMGLGGLRKVLKTAVEIGDDVVFEFTAKHQLKVEGTTISALSDDILV